MFRAEYRGIAAVAASLGVVSGARAQTCDAQWLSGAIPALNGTAYSTVMWDPDGPGPLPKALVVGGSFTLAGSVSVSNLALWDGVAWSDVGGGVSGTLHGATAVNALAVMANGDLVVGGAFDNAGAGGGAIVANCIARFNGLAWSRMQQGTPQFASVVLHLGTRPNGDLVALGGEYVNDDNTVCGPLVWWNDTTSARWSNPPSSAPNFQAYRTFTVLANGDVVVGGVAGSSVGSSAIWRWDDSQGVWTGFGLGINGTDPRWQVLSILEAANGDIVAAGNFLTAGGTSANSIARWNGSQWFAYGSGITYPSQLFKLQVRALAQMPNGDIVAGGDFDTAGGNPGGRIARWDGANWARLPQGAGDIVWSLLRTPQDELVIAGAYTYAGGSFSNKRIARYTDLPAPWCAKDPASQALADGATLTLQAAASTGFLNVSYQWKRDGADITNGAGGASVGGGVVSGASGSLASPTTGATITLTIAGAHASDSGLYTVVFTNTCGSGASVGADVDITAPNCPGDFNHDGYVNGNDYDAFAELFETGDSGADFNHDGYVNGNDFDAFAEHFEVGC